MTNEQYQGDNSTRCLFLLSGIKRLWSFSLGGIFNHNFDQQERMIILSGLLASVSLILYATAFELIIKSFILRNRKTPLDFPSMSELDHLHKFWLANTAFPWHHCFCATLYWIRVREWNTHHGRLPMPSLIPLVIWLTVLLWRLIWVISQALKKRQESQSQKFLRIMGTHWKNYGRIRERNYRLEKKHYLSGPTTHKVSTLSSV